MNGKTKHTVISVFAGCGGSSLGYKMAGFKELLAIDFDKYAVEIFKLNFKIPVWQKNIKEITGKQILDYCKIKKGDLDILDGSPPCQGFSTSGKRNVNNNKNVLFLEFVRLIKELQPKVFVMENVSGMIKGNMKGLFKEIIKTLKHLNYNVKCKLMNAMYYNVPQSRQRLIFVGVRNDLKKEPCFPVANNKVISLKDSIGDLLNKIQDEKINHIWIDELKKKTKTYNLALKARQGQKYAGMQKRLFWNKPASTIQTASGDLGIPAMLRNTNCHPILTRTLSIREIARVQAFPDDFIFLNDLCHAYKVIGNAVPPLMIKEIALNIKNQILKGL